MSDRLTGPGLSIIAYVSSATDQFDENRIPDLLARAREKNGDLDVTGLLLYENGNFLQLLEGEADTIEKLFDTIRNDPRHGSCTVLLREPIPERRFPDWTMGFRQRIPIPEENEAGVSNFLQEHVKSGRTSSQRVNLLLDTFRDIVSS